MNLPAILCYNKDTDTETQKGQDMDFITAIETAERNLDYAQDFAADKMGVKTDRFDIHVQSALVALSVASREATSLDERDRYQDANERVLLMIRLGQEVWGTKG